MNELVPAPKKKAARTIEAEAEVIELDAGNMGRRVAADDPLQTADAGAASREGGGDDSGDAEKMPENNHDPGSATLGWADAKLADGTVVEGVLDPVGLISPQAVQEHLDRLGLHKIGEAQQIKAQRLFICVCQLVNALWSEDGSDDMFNGIKNVLRTVLGNIRLEKPAGGKR